MKTNRTGMMTAGMMMLGMAAAAAMASEAETSAAVSSNRRGPGVAEATAGYEGDIGLARTDTHSGRVSVARGLAVGLDEGGLTLSASHALGNRFGLGVARNLNLSIGRDGQVAVSGGRTLSYGPFSRSAEAGGVATAGRQNATALSWAAGSSDRHGFVRTATNSHSLERRDAARIGRWLARRLRR